MIHQKPKASRQYRVEEPGTLLPFLLTAVGDKSRNTVKGLLTRGQVQWTERPSPATTIPLPPAKQ